MKVFNNPQVLIHGWYWALPSRELLKLAKKEISVFGESLVLYRTSTNKIYCIEAYCPHMGAHLKEGKVVGENLRCGFHGWTFSGQGVCQYIPCAVNPQQASQIPKLKTFQVKEKYGMTWIHSDPYVDLSQAPLPAFQELESQKVISEPDEVEVRNCHPTIILGGGVDEEHFLTVHEKTTSLSGPLHFEFSSPSQSVISFENKALLVGKNLKQKFLKWLYKGTLKYKVTYWSATTAFAELGFPSLPLYCIFAYRPTLEGKTEGLNIYVTPKRSGPWGWIVSKLAIKMTQKILRGGGDEDRVIQNSICFKHSPHAFNNPPFKAFVDYVENQKFRNLGGLS